MRLMKANSGAFLGLMLLAGLFDRETRARPGNAGTLTAPPLPTAGSAAGGP
jgi:hypothetical protein